MSAPCSSFSGGWKMRAALARLLLSDPDFLVLDEPSNHLDASARAWLSGFVAGYPKSVLLVSHDVALVDGLLEDGGNCVVELNPPPGEGVNLFKSCKSFGKYLEEKKRRHAAATSEYLRNQAEADRLQSWVDKFGASANKASAAQSKLKAIGRMRDAGLLTDPGELRLPGASVLGEGGEGGEAGGSKSGPRVKFPPPPPGGDVLLTLDGADLSYAGQSAPLLPSVSLSIEAGSVTVLRGPNGAGKSTLLKALTGSPEVGVSPPSSLWRSPGAFTNVFTQDLAQDLPLDVAPVECVAGLVRGRDITISDTRIRTVLGTLGLSSFAQTQLIGKLSGGEKARVALASFVLQPANVLVLDEPSNHLDVDCIAALADGLAAFEEGETRKRAAVIVISHDREFVERLSPTHVCVVNAGKVKVEERSLRESDWSKHWDAPSGASASSPPLPPTPPPPPPKTATSMTNEERKRRLNGPRRIKKIEASISELEKRIKEVDGELGAGADAGRVVELSSERMKLDGKVEALMEEWEGLEQLLTL
ncbi:hypothetical protein TeGR_g14910 [Tetraparma gracilis]|uniref:ABC transporter domain-containing protein n=1 Tax=Tetraparma gracilis TaxID=2962635 RepID=A0ABQ6MCU2_9STRA|nr:hypothetical protein TeGR_g14910 [Tetraparma gracilis]